MSWVSVDDRLPCEYEQVLAYCASDIGVDQCECIFLEDFEEWNVTHWQPLPEPPK